MIKERKVRSYDQKSYRPISGLSRSLRNSDCFDASHHDFFSKMEKDLEEFSTWGLKVEMIVEQKTRAR